MTDEAQQIAIAELRGWKGPYRMGNVHLHGYAPGVEVPADAHERDVTAYWDKQAHIPDYLNDLNAMHEVEKLLTQEHYDAYADWLWELVDSGTIAYPNKLIVAMATARQKAEAFLRAIGKWEELSR
jgi:hypothetical protein